MGVVCGLLAALCWGVGDFAITALARRVGTPRTLLTIQTFSLLGWIGLLAVFPHSPEAPTRIWLLALVAGLFHVAGLVTTYRAFEIGTLSFVSPIASSFAIVTALLYVVSGGAPAPIALAGTCLLVAGVAVVSRSTASGGPVTLRGVPEAIGSALSFGVMFWIVDSYIQKPLGDVWPLILLKVLATLYAAGGVIVARKNAPAEPLTAPKTLLLGLAAALLDTGAWVAFLIGSRNENGAIVTAVASLFSAVTVLLAWMFLKERLSKPQWIGVAIVLTGILLVSLPR